MKKMIIMAAAATLLVAGCKSDPKPVNDSADESAPAAAERVPERRVVRETARTVEETQNALPSLVDPARNLPRFQGEVETDGYGLSMIIDGSSPEAFHQSLELIASDTTEAQYRNLDSSLRYLQMHALSSDGLPGLYRSLDGLSGEEVIELAARRMARRR